MTLASFSKPGTLITAVGAFALAVIVAFWSAAYILSEQDLARTLAEADVLNVNLARTLTEHATRTFDYADRIAIEVKTRAEQAGRGFNLEHYGRDAGINRDVILGITMMNARGDVIQMDRPVPKLFNIADREHFKFLAGTDDGKPYISKPIEAQLLPQSTIIVLSRRLNRRDGAFDGIISVVISPDAFTRFYRDLGLGDKGLVVLTGLDGFIRARNSSSGRGVGLDVRNSTLFKISSTRVSGTARYRSLVDEVTRRVAFRRLDKYPMTMAVGVAEETLVAAVYGRSRALYFGAAAASILALIASTSLVLMLYRRERDTIRVRASEARYRRLVEDSPDATFVHRNGIVLYANQRLVHLLGVTCAADLVGRTVLSFTHPDFHAATISRVESRKSQGEPAGGDLLERTYVRADGGTVEVEAAGVNVQLPDGPARHVVVRDISQRKRVETALRQSMERYRRMVEASPDATFINRAGKIMYANPAALIMLGASSASEVVGKSPLEIVHPDDREAALARIESMEAGEEFQGIYEQRFLRLDGATVETELSASVVVDEGVPSRQVVARDITARKKIEAALRESEARYRKLVEESPDATIISRHGMILYANPATLRLLGAQTVEQIVGQQVLRFIHPDFHQGVQQRLDTLEKDTSYAGAGLFERKYVRLDGSVVEVELSAVTVQLVDGPARHVVIRDVTARKMIEAALRDSEERYRMLVDTSPDAVIIYTDDKLSFVNPAAIQLFGAASADQLIGMGVQQMIHPSGQAMALARRAYVMKTGLPTGLWDQTFMRLDGTPIEVEGSTIGIPGTGNRQRLVTVRDISARKRAEEALRESESRLRMAVESANMTNWEWEIASDQTHWGYGHEQLLGPLPENSMQYPDFRSMVHADDRSRFLSAGRATMEHGVPYDVEFRLVRTDGVVRWMRHTGRALRDTLGRVEGMAGVMQDMTRRHDIEQELALSRQRRDALMESIPAPAWLKDRQGRFLAVNRAWYERLKQDPGFAIGRTNLEVFPGALGEERDREDERVMEMREVIRVERKATVDGRDAWFESVKSPVFDDNGEVSGLVGVSYETTERKLAEERLRASDERFRLFADAMENVFWIDELDPFRIVYVNSAYKTIWGRDPETLYADPWQWAAAIHEDDRARVRAVFEAWVNDPAVDNYNAEYRIVRPDGEIRWIKDFGTKLRDAGGRVYRTQGIAEDVSNQREAEQALAESRRRRDALLESNPDPAWLKDLQGRYIAVNKAWFTRRGLQPSNIVGKTDRDFFSAERVAMIEEEDRRVIATKSVMRSERNWNYADGASWIETVKSPVLDGDGNVTAIVGLSHDISERKRGEQAVQEMNDVLARQTAELTAVNRELESFAYTVSHDLRAPLRHIDGFVNLLSTHAGPTFDAQSTRYFERISMAAKRMGLLIDDLLAFSRTGRAELRLQRVSLDRVLRETIEHLKPDTAGRRIEWKVAPLPEVRGDSGLLAIVLQNLVSNAVKYTRPREVAQIEIGANHVEHGMTTLSVRDNGVGFDMQYHQKLFGVFQRLHTDAEFEGTGIGLATVARIVQRHGGSVSAESEPGRGSCFCVTLPLASKTAVKQA